MDEKPQAGGQPARTFVALVLFLVVIYNSNFRWYLTKDSTPARVLPFSLLLDGHLYVDDWVEPYTRGRSAASNYFVTTARGHVYSVYPIIEPLAVTPLYALPAFWLSQQKPRFAEGSFLLTFIIDSMEKLSASLIAALSAGFLFFALRKLLSPSASVIVTLVYALASNTWCTSSQTLWRDGFSEFSFALLLWALFRDQTSPSFSFWVGLGLAMAAANKPVFALIVIPFLIYFALHDRKKLPLLCLPLLALGAAVLAYNFYFFGRVLGAYPNPLIHAPSTSPLSPTRVPWWDGFAGLLVSPNRGLFIYSSWTLLALWGAARAWRHNFFGWSRYLIAGMLGVYAVHARLGLWWGGGCFGPRYLTDLLPFMAFLLVPIWPRLSSSRIGMAALVITVGVSLWIQVIGAYFYPRGNWDSTPQTLEENPKRVWDWKDTQIVRTWRAGLDRPEILYEAPVFLSALAAESGKPAVRLAVIGLQDSRIWGEIDALRNEPAATLKAMESSDSELIQQAQARAPAGVKFYADELKMLDEVKPDAVLVAAPSDRHLQILRECAQQHVNVFVEEPMAGNATEAREMARLADAAGIKLMVNHRNVWLGASQELHARVAGGAIGRVRQIIMRDVGSFAGTSPLERVSRLAEWALWLKGLPTSVDLHLPGANTIQYGDVTGGASAVFKYPDATARLSISPDRTSPPEEVEILGPKGALTAAGDELFFLPPGNPATTENPHGRAIDVPIVLHETSSGIAYFVYHLRHDQAIEDPVSAGFNVELMEILDAAEESSAAGRAVEMANGRALSGQ